MKIKLYRLWTHIPALAVLVFMIVRLITAGHLPSRTATHFDIHGVPNGFGSPWLTFGITLGVSILFIALGIIGDELWARGEKAKSFNWISLLDEIMVGFMVGTSTAYLDYIINNENVFIFPWLNILVIAGAAVIIATVLELVRPFRPYPRQVIVRDTTAIEKEIREKLRRVEPFVYWDSQNPIWITFISILLPLVMLILAVVTWFTTWWVSLELLALGIIFTSFYGGLRTVVTRNDISVRLGIWGFRVLHLYIADLYSVSLREFSPLKDFGGYGIRFNSQMKAYFMKGSEGLLITTNQGKKYLIGSDHPENLLAVMNALISQR
jgi:hypothetical protein